MNAQNIESYQWKNRIVLLKSISTTKDLLQEQLQLFEVQTKAVEDREIIIFVLEADRVLNLKGKEVALSAAEITNKYQLGGFQGVILIGKDGGVKWKEPFLVKPNTVFDMIDAMPMRRREMEKERKID